MGETLGVPPCDWLGVSGRSSEGAGLASLPGCLIQYVNPCREHCHRSHPDAQEAQRTSPRWQSETPDASAAAWHPYGMSEPPGAGRWDRQGGHTWQFSILKPMNRNTA